MTDDDTQNIAPIVIDLGKKQRKQVKKLCRGEGKLVTIVADCLEELKSAGTIAENSQPIIVVVEKKAKPVLWHFGQF